MLTISHILSGYLVLYLSGVPVTGISLLLSTIFSILPDFDVLWSKTLNKHHDSIFHVPFFWIGVTLILFLSNNMFDLFPEWVITLFALQLGFHMISDYITTRSAGMFMLYPFSKKKYSLYPQATHLGNFSPFDFKSSFNLIGFYLENKALVAIEILVIISGAISLFIVI